MFSMASPGSPQSSVVFDTDLGGEETIGDPGAKRRGDGFSRGVSERTSGNWAQLVQ